jgi:hypothetical protein
MRRFVKADPQTRKTDSHLVFFILSLCLLGYSGYNVIAIVYYFYVGQGYALMYFNLEIVSGLVRILSLTLILPLSHISEEILWPGKYKIKLGSISFGFTAIFGTLIIISQIIWIILGVNGTYPGPFSRAPIFFVPLIISYIVFSLTGFFGITHIIFKRLRPQKNESRLIILGLSWAVIALIGALIQGITRSNPDTQKIYLVGIIIEIAGWGFVRHFLLDTPNYSEFEWRSSLISLYVVTPTGLTLYHHVFKEVEPEVVEKKPGEEDDFPGPPNSDLIACGIVGIKSLLEEITHQTGSLLKSLQIGTRNIIGGQAPGVITFIISEMDLGVFHTLMRELAQKISEKNPQIADFNGDVNSIKIKPFVEQMFVK